MALSLHDPLRKKKKNYNDVVNNVRRKEVRIGRRERESEKETEGVEEETERTRIIIHPKCGQYNVMEQSLAYLLATHYNHHQLVLNLHHSHCPR